MTPSLSGTGSIGKLRRKLLVMPEEVLSFSPCELCWPYVYLFEKKEKHSKVVYSAAEMLTEGLVAERWEQP